MILAVCLKALKKLASIRTLHPTHLLKPGRKNKSAIELSAMKHDGGLAFDINAI
jgi:hypothetical protein